MDHKLLMKILLFCALITGSVAAQVTIKPFYGFYRPRLNDVNSKIVNDIDNVRILLDAPVPSAGKFDGESVLGGQIEYHLNEDYFFNVSVAFYNEDVSTSFSQDGWQFDYQRDIDFYDFVLNLHYYFNYNSWRRVNYYAGIGVGYLLVRANSLTVSTSNNYLTDARGEFNGNAITAALTVGGHLKMAEPLMLWVEGGLQYGNVGNLDGKTTNNGAAEEELLSDSQFDLTGFFVRGGIGLSLGFLN